MTRDMMNAAAALAAVLSEENAALAGFDYARATALLGRKERALAELVDAQRAMPAPSADAAHREVAERLATDLRDLSTENRRLLEQAIQVQRRVVGVVFKAVPKTIFGAPRYAASGAMAASRLPPAVVLSSRV
jgi:hypothetical protein